MFHPLKNRLRQSLRRLRPLPISAETREAALKLMTPAQRQAFLRLSPYDRDHLFCVYDTLRSDGLGDPDLLVAGLMHDIGKHQEWSHVRFLDRVAKVVLGRLAPLFLESLALPPAEGWRSGLVLAVHHPAIGAAIASSIGCGEMTSWLIEHHEDVDDHGSDHLKSLQHSDSVC